ncbi:Hypothetical predicted protein [Scomber scombrus]|uniref:Uncharacterized protein n=1 Tax=Scomber scombrus TaxID=13677 RepID=A0AAV1NJ28_SCOSC
MALLRDVGAYGIYLTKSHRRLAAQQGDGDRSLLGYTDRLQSRNVICLDGTSLSSCWLQGF